uniref:Uncharacterized protein n=1 Tax=Arundo donax TaxID=35708 RepID=A0A0A9HM86_ARUDO
MHKLLFFGSPDNILFG